MGALSTIAALLWVSAGRRRLMLLKIMFIYGVKERVLSKMTIKLLTLREGWTVQSSMNNEKSSHLESSDLVVLEERVDFKEVMGKPGFNIFQSIKEGRGKDCSGGKQARAGCHLCNSENELNFH